MPEEHARPGATDATRRVTIHEVARLAGVSVSAVSKVVRDAYGVSPQMRARVTSAIDQLGYRPNAGARGMRGRTFTIGVVVSDISSPFQPEVVGGIRGELAGTPFQEVIVVGGATPASYRRATEALLDRQVDGFVLVAPFLDSAWLEQLAERTPVVAVALHGSPAVFDTVVDDDRLGAGLMVDHLVDLGHERIAHTGMPATRLRRPYALSHMVRQAGYEEAMARHGLTPRTVVTSYTEDGGYRAARELFSGEQLPTAVFAGADIAALGVLRAAEETGLRVPADLAVGGYDNTYMSTIARVSLSTVDQSGDLTGAVSARLLLERIEGRTQPVRYVVTPTLIPRGTTVAP